MNPGAHGVPLDRKFPLMTDDIPTLRRKLQQLKELHDSGALGDDKYKNSRRELERQLVEAVMAGAEPDVPPSAPVARPSGALLAGLAVLVLVVAGAGYWWTGSPGLDPGAAVAAAGPEGGGHEVTDEQMTAMTAKLAEHLKQQPDDAQGWAMLARSYAVVGRNDEALPAYKKAVELVPDDARLLADYADALAVKNNRSLDGEPAKLVERALKIDPDNIKALALAGTAAFDRKDYAGAAAHWERLVKLAPADAGFLQQVQAGIDEARKLGNLPPAADAGTAPAAPVAAVGGGGVSGSVSLSPALVAKTSPEDTVFVYARAAEGSRMPLAIVRKQVKDLPFDFKLDDSMAMSPAAKLSGAPKVIVGARISKAGQAMASPGDLSGQTEPMAPSGSGLKIVINEVMK